MGEIMPNKKCKHCIGDMHEEYISKYPEASHCMFCGRYIRKNKYNVSEPATVIVAKDDVLGNREESHPAYAQLQFSRQSGGYSHLYGSAIKHQETITMRVNMSRKVSSKYDERYYSEHMPLIEVRMSQSQFAQAITSMNMGSGVPVTLEALRGKVMPKCQEKTVSEIANRGLSEKMNEFADKISKDEGRIKEILEKKGTIKVGERKEIGSIYGLLMQDIRSNMPYLHECMIEAYDKTATASKADIEAFYTNAIMNLGLDALKEKQLSHDHFIHEIEDK